MKTAHALIQNFPDGYGEFPYFIIRVASGVFIQIPIRKVVRQYQDEEPRYCVHYFNLKNLKFYDLMDNENPEGTLMELAGNLHGRIPFLLCLVLSPFKCFYFEMGICTESDKIPKGGSLLDLNLRSIGMGEKHYKDLTALLN